MIIIRRLLDLTKTKTKLKIVKCSTLQCMYVAALSNIYTQNNIK